MTAESFLKQFSSLLETKSKQFNQALWILETTSSPDAADLRASLDTECKMLFNDRATYEKLLAWDADPSLRDPRLKRELNILIRAFKEYMMPPHILKEISLKEANLLRTYTSFRARLHGKTLSENDVKDLMKTLPDAATRKEVWEASKEIGALLAPQILDLVKLRNQGARALGYPDFFQMKLTLQEVDHTWLLQTFETIATESDAAYRSLMQEIRSKQSARFNVKDNELGPWAWSEPFCQEDPLDTQELDSLVSHIDIAQTANNFSASSVLRPAKSYNTATSTKEKEKASTPFASISTGETTSAPSTTSNPRSAGSKPCCTSSATPSTS
jgi:peptidyl-dipeptidase A